MPQATICLDCTQGQKQPTFISVILFSQTLVRHSTMWPSLPVADLLGPHWDSWGVLPRRLCEGNQAPQYWWHLDGKTQSITARQEVSSNHSLSLREAWWRSFTHLVHWCWDSLKGHAWADNREDVEFSGFDPWNWCHQKPWPELFRQWIETKTDPKNWSVANDFHSYLYSASTYKGSA